jgi:hypothetical protein
VLAGVKYSDRKGSWEFKVLNGYKEWYERYSEIMNYIQGKRFKVVLDDEPDYYYWCRLSMNSWQSDKDWSTIVIDYIAEPFKYPTNSTSELDWQWNELFDNVIYYGRFDVVNSKWRNFINDTYDDIPIYISATSPMRIVKEGDEDADETSIFIKAGIENEPIIITPGDNNYLFYGTGRVTVDYSRGRSL